MGKEMGKEARKMLVSKCNRVNVTAGSHARWATARTGVGWGRLSHTVPGQMPVQCNMVVLEPHGGGAERKRPGGAAMCRFIGPSHEIDSYLLSIQPSFLPVLVLFSNQHIVSGHLCRPFRIQYIIAGSTISLD